MSVGHTAVTPAQVRTAPPAPVAPAPMVLEPCGLPEHPDCGIRDVLDRLGDRWSVLAIVELAGGPRRFRALQRGLHGVSQRMLTVTLRRLERDGLVLRTAYPTVPVSVTYELTERGHSLTHLIRGLADWSLAHKDAIAASQRAWDATSAADMGGRGE